MRRKEHLLLIARLATLLVAIAMYRCGIHLSAALMIVLALTVGINRFLPAPRGIGQGDE